VVDRNALDGLPEDVAQRLLAVLHIDLRPLRIEIQEQRYLSQNRAVAERRLEELVAAALAPPPPPRRRTKPSASSEEQRLRGKALRGVTKSQRRPPEREE
jgi:ribosome-associated protein